MTAKVNEGACAGRCGRGIDKIVKMQAGGFIRSEAQPQLRVKNSFAREFVVGGDRV